MTNQTALEAILRDIEVSGEGIGVKSIKYERGYDLTGDDAIWIHIGIIEDDYPSKMKLQSMRSLAEELEKRLVKDGVSAFSYVNYVAA